MHIMIKKLLFLLVVIGLSGCTQEEGTVPVDPETKKATGATIPVEEALDELNALLGALSSETRAAGAFTPGKAIREIRVSGGSEATRSEGCDLPDTMVYVVNFSDDQGFAVLGARRSLEPVYAVTESGSFDAGKLNAAIAEAQARRLRGEESPETRTEEGAAPVSEIGTDYAYLLLADAMVAAPRIAADTLSKTYGPWQRHPAIGPLVEVKWDQTYPFNMNLPESSSWTGYYYKGRYPVGCGIIAAAQVMTSVRRPSKAPGYKGEYNWGDLNGISNYANLRSFTPSYSPANASESVRNYVEQMADVLHYLGVQFKATYDSSGTGVYVDDVAAALKYLDPLYYAKARVVPFATNKDAIYTNLDNDKPMYIRGTSPSGGGHAWVVDGYFTRSRTVTYELRMGYTGPIYTEQRVETNRFLHFNWGYQGDYDGYFAEGIFDMNQRDSKDDIIDAHTSNYKGSYNYGTSNSVILY